MSPTLCYTNFKYQISICLIAACLCLSACDSAVVDSGVSTGGSGEAGTGNMFAVIQSDDSFGTLSKALEATGLDAILANTEVAYTLFAPNDAAFDAMGKESVDALLADTDNLIGLLLYHIVPNRSVDSATAIKFAGTSIATANSDTLTISLNTADLMINDATIIRADVATSNGLVHEIDTVLSPPSKVDVIATLAGMPEYSNLVSLIQFADLAAPLADATKTYTIFAPTNAAFAALDAASIAGLANTDTTALSDALLGHTVVGIVNSSTISAMADQNITALSGAEWPVTLNGDVLNIDGANVIEADVTASNGIIHGIDKVLQ